MVQRLTHWLDVLPIQAGRHRLNALSLTGHNNPLQ
jgi:hypothetical protein